MLHLQCISTSFNIVCTEIKKSNQSQAVVFNHIYNILKENLKRPLSNYNSATKALHNLFVDMSKSQYVILILVSRS